MTASDSKSLKAIGFLTVLDLSEHGFFGGYLLVNTAGRPLEFHCTTPIKANRAQKILYGPTLTPFLYGEQIGKTLLSEAKTAPLMVCTDVEPALSVRSFISSPVILLTPPNEASPATNHLRFDESHDSLKPPSPPPFMLGKHRVAVSPTHHNDRELVIERWRKHFDGFDLPEPFGRIREAIEEAQGISG